MQQFLFIVIRSWKEEHCLGASINLNHGIKVIPLDNFMSGEFWNMFMSVYTVATVIVINTFLDLWPHNRFLELLPVVCVCKQECLCDDYSHRVLYFYYNEQFYRSTLLLNFVCRYYTARIILILLHTSLSINLKPSFMHRHKRKPHAVFYN